MKHPFGAALAVEARKLALSRVVWSATALLVLGIAVLTGAMVAAAEAGDERILAQLGDVADQTGWERLGAVAAQITAAAGLLGFGVVTAWVVGREFSDRTIGGLFAIPVARATIARAKLVVTAAWVILIAGVLVAVVLIVGTILIGRPDEDAVAGSARLLVLTCLTGLLATPAAWAATLGRGLLPGIALTVVMMATAQVLAVVGMGAWLPLAAPALWTLDPGSVDALQLGLVALVPGVFIPLTTRAWSRLQLDR